MRNPGGQMTIQSRDGSFVESDTFTCCHCQLIVKVAPRCSPSDFGGFCTLCNKPICPKCHASGECKPFEKWLDEQESSKRFRSAIEAEFERKYPRK